MVVASRYKFLPNQIVVTSKNSKISLNFGQVPINSDPVQPCTRFSASRSKNECVRVRFQKIINGSGDGC